jgi:hypothetical protein
MITGFVVAEFLFRFAAWKFRWDIWLRDDVGLRRTLEADQLNRLRGGNGV